MTTSIPWSSAHLHIRVLREVRDYLLVLILSAHISESTGYARYGTKQYDRASGRLTYAGPHPEVFKVPW